MFDAQDYVLNRIESLLYEMDRAWARGDTLMAETYASAIRALRMANGLSTQVF